MTSRTAIFQKSTRKNQEFERFLCDGQEAAILDATTSKYIPLSYFVGGSAPPRRQLRSIDVGGSTGGSAPLRRGHGLSDKMPFESFRLINLQQRGSHAHSLVLFKSRAITTNPEQIAVFECNGQVSQSEIRILHTSLPPREYLETEDTDTELTDTELTTDTEDTDDTTRDNHEEDSDEPGTVYDVSELYFSPVSPRLCMNFGNNRYNPGYCGIFGIIAMVFYRHWRKHPETWIAEWSKLLMRMREYIPNEPKCHGSIGTEIASKVQEIIAAHPSTHTGHQHAEREIYQLLEDEINN